MTNFHDASRICLMALQNRRQVWSCANLVCTNFSIISELTEKTEQLIT